MQKELTLHFLEKFLDVANLPGVLLGLLLLLIIIHYLILGIRIPLNLVFITHILLIIGVSFQC